MSDQEKQLEKKFFDEFDRDGGYERFEEKSYQKIFDHFVSLVQPKPGETVLDIGCGTGAFTSRLHQYRPELRITGLDISPGCIARAAQLYPEITFQVGDAEATALPVNSVDLICFFGVLHHFPDFSKVAEEAFRILKPGGRAFSFDPHHHNPVFWLFRSHSSPLYCSTGVTANERLITRKEFKEIFCKAGFKTNTRAFSGIRFSHVESKGLSYFLTPYNLWDAALGSIPLARLIGAWVVGVATKE